MTQRPAFLIEVLEHLASPLLSAVASGGASPDVAARMAELLGRSVQMGVALGEAVDIRDNTEGSESLRLAVTALAAGLVAGQYRNTGKTPDEADMRRQITALEAVLTFAANFTPAPDNIARLQGLVPDVPQMELQYLSVFSPLVSEVLAFSFGRPERKMMQDIAERLTARAVAVRDTLLPRTGDPRQDGLNDLYVLRALAPVFAECYRAEKQKIQALGDAERARLIQEGGGLLPFDPVWQAFEVRVAMMESLAAGLGGGASLPAGAGSGAAPATGAGAPQDSVVVPMTLPSPPAVTPPSSSRNPDSAGDGTGYNPMSFFKPGTKKQGDGTNG